MSSVRPQRPTPSAASAGEADAERAPRARRWRRSACGASVARDANSTNGPDALAPSALGCPAHVQPRGPAARGGPGSHGVPADLLVRPPDPGPLAPELPLPRRTTSRSTRRSTWRSTRAPWSRSSPTSAPTSRTCSGLCGGRFATERSQGPSSGCLGDRRRHDPGGDRRRGRRELHRGPPRRAVADRDPADRLRAPARLRGPAPAARALEEVASSAGPLHRPRPDPGTGPRRLALGDHDHRRPLPGARPRRRRAVLVPAACADHRRSGGVQGASRRGRRASRRGSPGR